MWNGNLYGILRDMFLGDKIKIKLFEKFNLID